MNRWLSGPTLGVVAVVAVAVSACGKSGTSTAGQTVEPSSSPAAAAGPPGASGTVAAVTAASLQVQNPRTGQVTVTFAPSTSFTKTVPAVLQVGTSNATRTVTTTQTTTFTKTAATDKSALAVGECVTAVGPSDDTGTVAASSISIRQPGPNGCQGGFGGPGRGRGTGQAGPGTAPTGGNDGVNGA